MYTYKPKQTYTIYIKTERYTQVHILTIIAIYVEYREWVNLVIVGALHMLL